MVNRIKLPFFLLFLTISFVFAAEGQKAPQYVIPIIGDHGQVLYFGKVENGQYVDCTRVNCIDITTPIRNEDGELVPPPIIPLPDSAGSSSQSSCPNNEVIENWTPDDNVSWQKTLLNAFPDITLWICRINESFVSLNLVPKGDGTGIIEGIAIILLLIGIIWGGIRIVTYGTTDELPQLLIRALFAGLLIVFLPAFLDSVIKPSWESLYKWSHEEFIADSISDMTTNIYEALDNGRGLSSAAAADQVQVVDECGPNLLCNIITGTLLSLMNIVFTLFIMGFLITFEGAILASAIMIYLGWVLSPLVGGMQIFGEGRDWLARFVPAIITAFLITAITPIALKAAIDLAVAPATQQLNYSMEEGAKAYREVYEAGYEELEPWRINIDPDVDADITAINPFDDKPFITASMIDTNIGENLTKGLNNVLTTGEAIWAWIRKALMGIILAIVMAFIGYTLAGAVFGYFTAAISKYIGSAVGGGGGRLGGNPFSGMHKTAASGMKELGGHTKGAVRGTGKAIGAVATGGISLAAASARGMSQMATAAGNMRSGHKVDGSTNPGGAGGNDPLRAPGSRDGGGVGDFMNQARSNVASAAQGRSGLGKAAAVTGAVFREAGRGAREAGNAMNLNRRIDRSSADAQMLRQQERAKGSTDAINAQHAGSSTPPVTNEEINGYARTQAYENEKERIAGNLNRNTDRIKDQQVKSETIARNNQIAEDRARQNVWGNNPNSSAQEQKDRLASDSFKDKRDMASLGVDYKEQDYQNEVRRNMAGGDSLRSASDKAVVSTWGGGTGGSTAAYEKRRATLEDQRRMNAL